MLAATWVLAVATGILALSGPVALTAWLNARRQDRERRQQEHEAALKNDILKDSREQFVPKTWIFTAAFISVVMTGLAWSTWSENKNAPGK